MAYKTDEVDEKDLVKVIDRKTGEVMKGRYVDKDGNARFEVGTQKCQLCGTFENILQLEMDNVKAGIPVTEIMFCCENCYETKLKKPTKGLCKNCGRRRQHCTCGNWEEI